ncbi:MAG: hypothetical protein J7L89_10340 [Bacteroidales bacterium]|nr:hypothetical protein [Bacteroidales bacterium]
MQGCRDPGSLDMGLEETALAVKHAALFLVRPWCYLLCPVKPVPEWIRMMRNWIFTPGKNRKS